MATYEKLEHDRAKLTMTISAEAFTEAIRQAYLKTRGRYKVNGFRSGKAPQKIIESEYGEAVFYEDAFELVWGDAYEAALNENGLNPVDKPAIDIEKISAEEGVVYTAEVQLQPTVTLGAYKGIEVEAQTYTVEDAAVDASIEAEREKNARFADVEHPVEDGNRIVLDYAGTVDGVAFDGGTAEEQTLLIGSGTFIPGFEEQLVGVEIGGEKDVTVTFPEDYHAEELKGKQAVFHCKVKSVQVKELPALDDEFAKDISEFDTLEELKKARREQLTQEAEAKAKQNKENEALKAACDNATVEIPEVMIDRQVNYMMRDIRYRLAQSGISLEDYCKYVGTDMDAMRKSYRGDAESRVKMQLVIEAIGKAEGVTCADEDLEKEIAEMAESYQMDAADFKKTLKPEDMDYLRDRATAQKSVAIVTDHAVETKKAEAAE